MKIGIFTAMKKEATGFVANSAQKERCGSFDIYTMKLGVHDAVLCCPPTIGEIAAAAACQLLVSRFKVDVIFNFGVVGALDAETALMSTMYVESVVHYDMDLSEIDNLPVGRYACFDDIAVQCDKQLLNKALQVEKLPVVRCASADKFVGGAEAKALLNKKYGATICDMESAAILFTCKFNNIPCLLVKCVSDSLTGGVGEYRQNAERVAAEFFAFAEKLAQRL